jgi:hypothetical protein
MFFDVLGSIQAIPSRVSKTKLTPIEISRWVRKCIKDQDILLKTCRSQAVDECQILVSGVYDQEFDQDGLPSIEVFLNYNPAQTAIELDLINWNRLAFDVAECMGHELVHKKLRCKKSKEYRSALPPGVLHDEQVYLGNSEEIQAYGFSIAADVAINLDGEFDQRFHADMYGIYQKTFDQDLAVMLQLDHEIARNLTQLTQSVSSVKYS